ncbi:hypothetical protein KQX54_020015 [Cotesia glomerata]|uniref:Uncharacterized protein n=1 Tax=Cotesia glomerata TaxID=32391 RepID=A0AAV7IYX3_COTGL|nr:hypothetical protein KQX54_020015 [Cotesia glomerata]
MKSKRSEVFEITKQDKMVEMVKVEGNIKIRQRALRNKTKELWIFDEGVKPEKKKGSEKNEEKKGFYLGRTTRPPLARLWPLGGFAGK